MLERYRLLVANIRDYAIFHLDTTGHIASWNDGAQRLKGYQADEIIGKHFSTFYTPKDLKADKPAKELEIAIAEGRVEDEGWRVRKDGTRFWANVVITALFDSQGKHQGFAKVTRDLTERKAYEDNLYHANVKLGAQFNELKELNAAKEEFVSLASHQLRTPATGVKQYLSLLLGGYAGKLTDKQMEYLRKAYQSNDRQIEIVNDLLQVARLDAGKVVLAKSRTDIGELISDVIDEQIDSFKARRQTVKFHMPEQPVVAVVDSDRLRMVLENLIDNASKYTPDKGSICVDVEIGDAQVKVEVADTGVGIAKKDQGRIFEKFSRIQNPLTHNAAGSGLGLYWTDKVVKLHGGRVEVQSAKNKGTTFTVLLPKEGQVYA